MAKIEERVLSMKFDNKQFVAAASETMGTLEKLKSAMNPTNLTKGIGRVFGRDTFSGLTEGAKVASESVKMVSDVASSVDLSGLSKGTEGASGGFTAMQGVALGAMATIGAKAIEIGVQMATSFVQPMQDGFAEYETKINAIQRIQANTASKGTSMDEITGALDELNTYADKTIYNFGQMTDNIGRFTAGGVDLETSVSAIKGISNVAALAGATSAESSRATTQLAQAIGGGDIRLQDWMSIENAGMDNTAFKTALFEAGKNLGKLTDVPVGQNFDEWTESGNNFRNTLSDGWLTVDVMNEALSTLTGDLDKGQLMAMGYSEATAELMMTNAQAAVESATNIRTFTQLLDTVGEVSGSAWVGVFEPLIGDLDQATELFTGLNNFIEPIVTAFPLMLANALGEWADLGGRADLIQGVVNIFQALQKLLGPIGKAFGEVFTPLQGKTLYDITAAFLKFTEALSVNETFARNLGLVFKGLFIVIKTALTIVGYAIAGVGLALYGLGKAISTVGSGFADVFSRIGRAFNQLKAIFTKGDFISGPFDESDYIIDKMFTLREALVQIKSILTMGDFISGPFEESDAIIDKIFTIREAIMQVATIFTKGDFISGPFEESDWVIDKLFKMAEIADKAQQAFHLLFRGDFVGGFANGWHEDEVMVDKLLRVREVMGDTIAYWQNFTFQDFDKIVETLVRSFMMTDFNDSQSMLEGLSFAISELTVFGFEDTLRVLTGFKDRLDSVFGAIGGVIGEATGRIGGAWESFSQIRWRQFEGLQDMGPGREHIAGTIAALADIPIEDAFVITLAISGLASEFESSMRVLKKTDFSSIDSIGDAYAGLRSIIFSERVPVAKANFDEFVEPVRNIQKAIGFLDNIDWTKANTIEAGIIKAVWAITRAPIGDVRDATQDFLERFGNIHEAFATSLFESSNVYDLDTQDGLHQWLARTAHLFTGIHFETAYDAIKGLSNLNDAVKTFGDGLLVGLTMIDYEVLFAGIREKVVKMGSSIGTWISEAIAKVNWKVVGEVLATGLVAVVSFALGLLGGLATLFFDFFKGLFTNLDLSPLLGIFEGAWPILKNAIGRIGDILTAMAPAMSKGVSIVGNIFGGLLKIVGWAVNGIADILSEFDIAKWFNDVVGKFENMDLSSMLTGLGIALSGGGLFAFANSFKGIFDSIGKVGKEGGKALKQVTSNLKTMEKEVKTDNLASIATSILKIAVAIGILAIAFLLFASIPFEDMKTGLMGFAAVILIVTIALKLLMAIDFPKDSPLDPKGSFKDNLLTVMKDLGKAALLAPTLIALGVALVSFGIAVALITGSLYLLSKLEMDELMNGLIALTAIFAILIIAVWALPEKKVLSSALAIIGLATAVNSLQKGLRKMGEMSWSEIARGLLSFSVSMAVLVIATRALDGLDVDKVSGSFFKLAIAMMVFAMALRVLNELPWSALLKGFAVLVVVLGGMAIVGKTVPEGTLAKLGSQLILVAVSLFIFAAAMKMFASMSWETTLKGIGIILLTLVALGLGFKTFPAAKVGASAVSILAVSVALLIMTQAVKALTQVDLLGAAIAVVVLAGAMVALSYGMDALSKKSAGASKATKKTKKSFDVSPLLKMGVAMVVASVGIAALSISLGMLLPVIAGFAALGLKKVAIGMAGIGIALVVLTAGGWLLKPVVGVFIALAGAMLMISVSAFVFAAALTAAAFAVALLALAGAGAIALLPALATALAQSIVNIIVILGNAAGPIMQALGMILYELIVAVRDLIVQGGPILVEAFVGLLKIASQAIIRGAPMVAQAIIVLVQEIMRVIVEAVPDIADALVTLIVEVFGVITESAPAVAEAFLALLEAVLVVLAEGIPMIVGYFVDMIVNIIDMIGEKAPELVDAWVNLLNSLADTIREKGPELKDAFLNVLDALTGGISTKAVEWKDATSEGVGNAVQAIKDWFQKAYDWASQLGDNIRDGILASLRAAKAKVSNAISNLTGGMIGTAKEDLDSNSPSRVFMAIGSDVVAGLTNGIDENADKSAKASGVMATGVINSAQDKLGINSPSKVFNEIGNNVNEGLAQGIEENGDKPVDALEENLDKMVDVADDKAGKVEKSTQSMITNLLKMFALGPVSGKVDSLQRRAKIEREDAFKARSEAVLAREVELEEQIESSQDSIDSARDSAAKAREDADKMAADAEKSQNEKDRASRKADLAHKKIAKEEQKYQEALAEQAEFAAAKSGYLAGAAWSDGVVDGVTDSEGRILTEVEILTDKLKEEYEKMKKDIDDVVGVFQGLKSAGDSISSISDNIRGFERAYKRLQSATSSRSVERNMGMMLDSIIGIGEGISGIVSLYESFEPYISTIIGSLNSLAPGMVGASMGVIGAIAGIGIFLYDMANEQKILGLVKKVFFGVLDFLKKLPKLIVGFIRTMIQGLINTFRELPKFAVEIIHGLTDLVTELITMLPEIVEALVEGFFELLIAILSDPFLLVRAAVQIAKALVMMVPRIAVALVQAFFGMGEEIVRGLIRGISGSLNGLKSAIVDPFVGFVNTVLGFFGIKSPSRLFMGIGQDLIGGLVEGLDGGSTTIENSATRMGNHLKNAFNESMSGVDTGLDGELRPVITPVLDLTEFDRGLRRMRGSEINTGMYLDQVNAITESENQRMRSSSEGSANNVTNIEYVQNNTSARPLSTIEIYRNTQRQLELMK